MGEQIIESIQNVVIQSMHSNHLMDRTTFIANTIERNPGRGIKIDVKRASWDLKTIIPTATTRLVENFFTLFFSSYSRYQTVDRNDVDFCRVLFSARCNAFRLFFSVIFVSDYSADI